MSRDSSGAKRTSARGFLRRDKMISACSRLFFARYFIPVRKIKLSLVPLILKLIFEVTWFIVFQMCFDIDLECGSLNDVEGAESFDRKKFFLRVKK